MDVAQEKAESELKKEMNSVMDKLQAEDKIIRSIKSKSEDEGPSENDEFKSALDDTLDVPEVPDLGDSLELSKTVDQTVDQTQDISFDPSLELETQATDFLKTEASEMLEKFSSGKVRKEQLVQLINHIISGPMPF